MVPLFMINFHNVNYKQQIDESRNNIANRTG